MMPWALIILLLLIQPSVDAAVTAQKCIKVQSQINNLQRKLRQGYNVKKGERLKKKLRQYERLRYQCMKKRLPIR